VIKVEEKEKNKKQKEHYEKPQMKKVYSQEHNRHRPFDIVASSGGCGGGCGVWLSSGGCGACF
jgi:hypothetical protein